MKIILGSKSESRKELLKEMDYDFEVVEADIEEKEVNSDNYYELPLLRAEAKAQRLIEKFDKGELEIDNKGDKNLVLITCDQIVVCNEELYEKPSDKEELKQFLRDYSRNLAEAVTGVVVVNLCDKKQREAVDIGTIYFEEIPEESMDKIIENNNLINRAGGISIDSEELKPYINAVYGNTSSIKGLPKPLVKELVKEVNLKNINEARNENKC